MRYIKLGKTDIEVSVVGFGAWAIGGMWWGGTEEKESIEAIRTSLDTGVNFIDTAPAYGRGVSEEFVAKAIGSNKRDEIVLATKCGLRWDLEKGMYFFDYDGVTVYRYLGKDSIETELDRSLKRLKTDYIDLYQTHWQDPTTPIEETMETLMELKKKGKIRAIGVSNVDIEQIRQYAKFGVVDSDQEQYSLIDRKVEIDLLPWCIENGATMLAYSPMARGLLTGRMTPDRKVNDGDSRGQEERFSSSNIKKTNDLLDKYLKPVADNHGVTAGNIAVAWITSKPNTIALVGARNEKQALENSAAADVVLDSGDVLQIGSFIKEASEDII